MEVSPVRKYARPRFPAHEILRQHPELLRIVPRRWRSNPVVLATLTSACLFLASRVEPAPKVITTGNKIAPVFQHGDGLDWVEDERPPLREVVGNYIERLSIRQPRMARMAGHPAPPTKILTEAEAGSIIADEAAKAGLVFTSPKSPVTGVKVPVIEKHEELAARDASGKLTKLPKNRRAAKAKVTLDGVDTKRRVSYEFVSVSDYNNWRVKRRIPGTTVDVLGAAAQFRDNLVNSGINGYCGVFYDPICGEHYVDVTEWRTSNDSKVKQAVHLKRSESEMQLRAQVKDFIKWLKAQGVI